MRAWPHREIARLADAQLGQVTRVQLLELGLGRGAIQRGIASGRLYPTYRGVYAVGDSSLPALGREMGAVLACGPYAVLSHHSAAAVWGIRPRVEGEIDVAVVGRHPGRRLGLAVHRLVALDPRDIRRYLGVPLTSPARTLLDVASGLPVRDLERAFDETQVLGLSTVGTIRLCLGRYPHHPGRARLAELAEHGRSMTVTRSEAEERFLSLLRRAALPDPAANARVGRYTVDFLWRSERVAVEIDGFRYHRSASAFERDHEKTLTLRDHGIEVLRFTAVQVTREPEASLVRLAQALGPGR